MRYVSTEVRVVGGKPHAWETLGFWGKSCHFFPPGARHFCTAGVTAALEALFVGDGVPLQLGGQVYKPEPSL